MLACVLAGGAFGAVRSHLGKSDFSATTTLTIVEPTAGVSASELMPLIKSIAESISAESSQDASIQIKDNLATRTIDFVATADSAQLAVDAANNAASQTVDEAKAVLSELIEKYRSVKSYGESYESIDLQNPSMAALLGALDSGDRADALAMVTFLTNNAEDGVSSQGRSGIVKFAVLGCAAGVLAVLCMLVLIQISKSPIKGSNDLEKALKLPVFSSANDSSFGERLWAFIRFGIEGPVRRVCLVSINDVRVAKDVADALRAGICESARYGLDLSGEVQDGLNVDRDLMGERCDQVDLAVPQAYLSSAECVFEARQADAVVLCVRTWSDSLRGAKETLAGLNAVRVKVLGIVLVG